MTQHISRRGALKVGAHSAWAVPVISIASAAPAYAGSGNNVSLVLDDFSASYTSDFSGERGDQLVTSFVLRSTGTAPATDLTFSLLIPPGLYATPPNIINSPSSWIALPPSFGTLEDGWEVRWFRSGDLAQSQVTGNEADPFRVQFTDPLIDAPYRRWAAKAFAAQLLVQPSNSTSVIGGYDVPAGPLAVFPVNEYHGSYIEQYVTLYGVAQNFGRSSSNDVTLRFWWNPEPGDPAWGLPPVAASSPELGTGVVSGDGTSGDDPWYITFPNGHGPTATRASYETDATPDELATTEIPFRIDITLAETPTHSRDFYMTVRSDDSADPVANGLGWASTIVARQILDS